LPSPLVGRERERSVLRDHFARARAGQGHLVLVGGEAGIGKTALAEEAYREAQEHGALVLVGRCYDLTETPPYGAWVDLLARYRPTEGTPPLPEAFTRRGTVGPVASQAVLFTQVLDFITALTDTHSLVLLLDDLHWADPASLDLLRFLARSLADLPIVILATYRSDELTRRHPLYQLLPTLVRDSGADRLDLHALDRAAIHALIALRYPLPDAEAERLAEYLHTRTEGNALFVGELLRALVEEGVLRRADGRWQVGDPAGIAVPRLLRQVIDGRVGRLDDAVQQLLAVAAVIGQEVSLALWATVAAVEEDAVLAAIEQGVEARLLVESAGADGARFAHALIREAVYAGIAPLQRRRLHRRVAEVLAATHAPDPDTVAYHFQRVGDARAEEWLIAAGERAQRAYARLTAAARFEAALGLLEARRADAGERGWLLLRLGLLLRFADRRKALVYLEGAEHLAAEAGDALLGASARFNAGNVLVYGGDLRRGTAVKMEAVAALDALPPIDAATRQRVAAMGIAADTRHHRGGLALSLAFSGDIRHAQRLAEGVAREMPAAPWPTLDGACAPDAHAALGLVYALQGQPTDAHAAWERSYAACRAIGDPGMLLWFMAGELWWTVLPYRADNPAARRRLMAEMAEARRRASTATTDLLRLHLGDIAVLTVDGAWKEALRLLEAMRAQPGCRLSAQDIASMWGPLVHAREGAEAVRPLIEAALPDGPETAWGDLWIMHVLAVMRLGTEVALDKSDLPGAEEWLVAHDRWLAWSGAVLGQAEGEALWAQYHRQAGDIVTADEHAERALAHASDPRQPLALIAAHRLLGELMTEADRFESATVHLDAALALATACAAPYERAVTLLALAELYAATRTQAEASAALEEVRAICESLGARPTLIRADNLAQRLAASNDAPPTHPAGLSPREVEVLRLVAQGLTNPQVAQEIFLSPRTVQQHLRSIYNKIGVSTRAAAARWAAEHSLA
jgi:DNA-binding NarL/FixJ family response regulator